jgi:hypothetical protein
MNNVKVELWQSGSKVFPISGDVTTNASGYYSFTDVCEGTYDVVFTTVKPVGGINATDAALVNAWPVNAPNYPTIQRVRFIAGDVTGSNSILGNDASRIQQYFLQQGNPPFSVNKWSFWSTGAWVSAQNPTPATLTITVPPASGPITQDFWGLATGDFNRSFTPGGLKGASESLTLNYGETKVVEANSEFVLPITAGMDMEVGAISLILDFPSNKLDVQDVYLTNDPEASVQFIARGDELRISWYSLTPLVLNKGETLLSLRLRMLNPANEEQFYISLAADPLNELADGKYNVIPNALISVDVLKSATVGTPEFSVTEDINFSNHPNPFNGTTNFVYSLPEDGQLTIEVFDIVGNKIKLVVDEQQTVGEYQLKMDAATLQPGIYTATLKLKTRHSVMMRTIKIISH